MSSIRDNPIICNNKIGIAVGGKHRTVFHIHPHPGNAVRTQEIGNMDFEIVGQRGCGARKYTALDDGGIDQFKRYPYRPLVAGLLSYHVYVLSASWGSL